MKGHGDVAEWGPEQGGKWVRQGCSRWERMREVRGPPRPRFGFHGAISEAADLFPGGTLFSLDT